jgi:uncharacterized protein (TIRG00374 family)
MRPALVPGVRRGRRLDPAHVWLRLGLFAAGAVVIFFLFRRVDWSSTSGYLARLGFRAPLVLVPTFFVLLSDTLGWQATFEQPSRLPLARLWRVRVATDAVAGSLPAGVALGESLRVLLLQRQFGLTIPQAAANVVVAKLAMALSQGLFLVCGVAIAGLPIGVGSPAGARPGTDVIGIIVALAFAATMGGALLLLAHGRILTRALGRIRSMGTPRWRGWWARLEGPVEHLDQGFAMLTRVPRRQVALALALFFVGWMCLAIEDWLILRLFGAHVSLAIAISVEAVVSIVRIFFFLVPGGLGAQEAGYYGLLVAYGVPNAESIAAAFVIAKRAKELFWIALGYLFLLFLPATLRETGTLQRADAPMEPRNQRNEPPIQGSDPL